jgi:hypothetical protein
MLKAGINRRGGNDLLVHIISPTKFLLALFLGSFIFLSPEIDKGIGELKANPHWVDQGSNDPICVF